MKSQYLTIGLLALILALSVGLGIYFTTETAQAGTTQQVTVNATPEYITISNAPATFNFGVVTAGTQPNTTSDYFTVTNGSSVDIDISINCTGWSAGTPWTYGAPGADTGRLMASSGEGGVGGSTGSGNYDIVVTDSGQTLLCDAVGTTTDPQWEMELEAPNSYSHSSEQTTTTEIEAVAD